MQRNYTTTITHTFTIIEISGSGRHSASNCTCNGYSSRRSSAGCVLAQQGGVGESEFPFSQGGVAPVVEAAVGQAEGAQEVPHMPVFPFQ